MRSVKGKTLNTYHFNLNDETLHPIQCYKATRKKNINKLPIHLVRMGIVSRITFFRIRNDTLPCTVKVSNVIRAGMSGQNNSLIHNGVSLG